MRLSCKMAGYMARWSNLWADSTEELLTIAGELKLVDRNGDTRLIDEGLTTERLMVTDKKRREAIGLGVTPIRWGGPEMRKLLLRRERDEGLDWKLEGL